MDFKRPFRPLKNAGIRWLSRQLASLPRNFDASIGMNSTISREGDIENAHGGASYVMIGNNSFVRGRLFTYGHGGKIKIGDWCYVGARSEIWSMDSVTIGNRVLIAHDVNIHDGSAHSKDSQERHKHYQQILLQGHPDSWDEMPGVTSDPIVIEDDVWISFGASILQGVTIGARSIIAAGSIVTKDIPSDTFYRCEVQPVMEPFPSRSKSNDKG